MDQIHSLFRALGLKLPTTEADVKDAYRKLARQWHPDRVGPVGQEKMQEVNQAYETIMADKLWEYREYQVSTPKATEPCQATKGTDGTRFYSKTAVREQDNVFNTHNDANMGRKMSEAFRGFDSNFGRNFDAMSNFQTAMDDMNNIFGDMNTTFRGRDSTKKDRVHDTQRRLCDEIYSGLKAYYKSLIREAKHVPMPDEPPIQLPYYSTLAAISSQINANMKDLSHPPLPLTDSTTHLIGHTLNLFKQYALLQVAPGFRSPSQAQKFMYNESASLMLDSVFDVHDLDLSDKLVKAITAGWDKHQKTWGLQWLWHVMGGDLGRKSMFKPEYIAEFKRRWGEDDDSAEPATNASKAVPETKKTTATKVRKDATETQRPRKESRPIHSKHGGVTITRRDSTRKQEKGKP